MHAGAGVADCCNNRNNIVQDIATINSLRSCGVEPWQRIEAELAEERPGLRLRWLDAAEIRARSRGRIANAYGLNARVRKPERGGLLCSRIFGPTEELRCMCGKYDGERHRDVTCDRCGVTVLPVAVRCERFGHIELPAAVSHPWSPERMLECLLVLPAGLREPPSTRRRLDLPGVSGLYQRVVQRAARLAPCIEHHAPSPIIEHETMLLGRSVARLVGRPRRRPGPGPSLAQQLQRALLELDPRAKLPWKVIAILAAVGLAVERTDAA